MIDQDEKRLRALFLFMMEISFRHKRNNQNNENLFI